MHVQTLLFGAVLALLALGGSLSARVPVNAFEHVISSEATANGLKGTAQNILHLGRHRDEDEMGIASIRFFVPPSEGEDFEDAWLDLEKDVRDEEDHNEVFDLKKSKLDNLIYYSYGEWKHLSDLHEHVHSDHFQEFAEYVDDHGISWELRILTSESDDIEDKQRRLERKSSHKNMAHVLFNYYVPPGEADKFTESWNDAAEKTIEEPGNRIISLRKVATDNTRYYGYGTWDSVEDVRDHIDSKHVERLMDELAERNIVVFVQPLVKIGNQDE